MPIVQTVPNSPNKSTILAFAEKHAEITEVYALQLTDIATDTAGAIIKFNTLLDELKATGMNIWVRLSPALPGQNFNILSPPATPSWFTTYLAAIEARLGDIERVILDWSSCNCCGGYHHWISGHTYGECLSNHQPLLINSTLAEFQALAAMVPNIAAANKLGFTCLAIPFEREAKIFEGDLGNATLLQWLVTNNAIVVIPRGSWVLHSSKADHKAKYSSSPMAGGTSCPIHSWAGKYSNSGTFPYTYYTDYIKTAGVEFWSEAGYDDGIRRGNIPDLMTAGYYGVMFYANIENEDAYDNRIR